MRLRLCILFLFLGNLAFGQDEFLLAKRWMVGGNGLIYIERIGGSQGRLIARIEPQVGYFLNNHWAIGARIPFEFSSNEWQIGGSLFTRYYFLPARDIKPFLEANGGYNLRVIPDVSGTVENSYDKSWLFGWRAGGAFFLNQNVSIDLYLYQNGYSSKSTNPITGTASNSLYKYEMGVGAGFQVYL